jgi:hypothetical protein
VRFGRVNVRWIDAAFFRRFQCGRSVVDSTRRCRGTACITRPRAFHRSLDVGARKRERAALR